MCGCVLCFFLKTFVCQIKCICSLIYSFKTENHSVPLYLGGGRSFTPPRENIHFFK